MEHLPFINYGWRCPVCGRVYAPGVQECFGCNDQVKVRYSYTTSPLPEKKKNVEYCDNDFRSDFV